MEWCPCVLPTSEDAMSRCDDQESRSSQRPDPEVLDRRSNALTSRAHHPDDRDREDLEESDCDHSSEYREGDRLDGESACTGLVSLSHRAGDEWRRPIGEEVEDEEGEAEDRGVYAECGEGYYAEAADEGGIDQ